MGFRTCNLETLAFIWKHLPWRSLEEATLPRRPKKSQDWKTETKTDEEEVGRLEASEPQLSGFPMLGYLS